MDEAGGPVDSNPTANASSVGKFVNPSILLFIDQLVIAAGGWVFWLIISKIATTSEIGFATTIYSIVLLMTTITQLGLEYPLLKKSTTQSHVFGTTLAIKLLITLGSLPITLLIINSLYQANQEAIWLAIALVIFTSIGFIPRFALLGISDARTVFVYDILGSAIKFVAGYFLVFYGFGSAGILIAFMLNAAVVTLGTLMIALRTFRWKMGDTNYIKDILKEGLVNTPAKLARNFILSLSVILLAYVATDSSEIGIFYIAAMLSVVVGGFGSNIAFMVIPASSRSNQDLTANSARVGLSLTAPIIAAIISAPGYILSIIGSEYTSADEILVILALGVLPFFVVMNAVSKFNNLNQLTKILVIGLLQLSSFLISFLILAPEYGTTGAAYSMLIGFTASSIPSLIWSERQVLKYLVYSITAIVVGWIVSLTITSTINPHPIISIVLGTASALGIIIILKGTSISELKRIMNPDLKRRS